MLTPGTRLGHYKVLEPIGAGGMGEVYRARDERLNRDVAIKVLPEAFAQDADRLARFQREAQLLASLNHSNIAAIYGLEESEGLHCLVLELVEGETLAERIQKGPLALEEALNVSRQIAEALEAAHDRGIIHRDLKPGNVKVTPEGMVKVLDFGLAKALEGEPAAVDVSKSPTLGAPASQVGILLGTAGYMSPEQAKGKPVDRRADIWAFGVVLVEMLTGKPLFEGETVSETLAAVMMREPDLSALPGDTPPPIRRLLGRCLQKDPRQRLQAIGEARIVMEDLLAGKVEEAVVPGAAAVIAQPAWRRLLPWGLLVVVAVGAATAAAFWSPWQSEPVQQPMRLRVEISPENPLYVDLGAAAVLSPDGTKLAYVAGSGANRMLYLRTLEQYEGAPLSGTEGARSPFFSPDGQWIGFFTNAKLKKVSVSGGAPLTLCDTQNNRGGTWGPDDTIVFAPDITTGLSRVPASGGTPEPITERQQGERSHRWPSFLPDGQHVLFIGQRGGQDYDDASIEVLNLETGERKVVHEGGTYPRYLPTGHLAYIRDATLFAAPFDLDRLEVTGTPAPVLQEVLSTPGGTSGTGDAQYAFSQNGLLVYLTGTPAVQKFPIVRVDRSGNVTPMVEDQHNYSMPRLSPDGTRLALVIEEESSTDIWVYDIERGAMTRLTFGDSTDSVNIFPVWSPDGRWLAFASTRHTGPPNLYLKRADGAGEAKRLTESDRVQLPTSFSPGAQVLAFFEQNPETEWDIKVLRLGGEDLSQANPVEPEVFLATPVAEGVPEFSPDGRWIAYISIESGQGETYVRPFPGPGGKWQISTDGGIHPRWTRGGRELVYRSGDKWMAVSITVAGDSLRASKPRQLFEGPFVNRFPEADYDVSSDGTRFVMFQRQQTDQEEVTHTHLNLILNWFEEVRRRAPAGKK